MRKKLVEPFDRSKNVSLHPIMSDSLGNYEPKDLPPRSGPGEGGNTELRHKKLQLFFSLSFK
jgi:hypothetical protein